MNHVEIIQLSRNNIAITFNKQALKGLEHGDSQAVKLKQGFGKKDITFLFMRDKDFHEKFSKFNQGLPVKKSWWSKLWPFKGESQITIRESKNHKYKDVK